MQVELHTFFKTVHFISFKIDFISSLVFVNDNQTFADWWISLKNQLH